MSAIYCRQGHQNSSDNRFCRFCGEPLTTSAAQSVPEPPAAPNASALSPIVGDRYRLRQQLGHGGFGKTYLAEDINRFNEPCVLKEFAPQVDDPSALKKAEQLFEREAGVLYQLQHSQIPRFRELLRVELEGKSRLFLVQDYIRGQNYQELLDQRQQRGETFSESDILQLFKQVLPVLGYIHQKGVIHRDISPDNLMRRHDDQLPILIDFGGVKQAAISVISNLGQAKSSPPPANVTIVGKYGYAPHEQMAAGDVEPHNDFYALAVTALVLMTGQSPQALLDVNSPSHWQTLLSLSPLLARVLRKMLSIYPSDRYTSANAILSTLFPPPSSSTPPPAPPIVSPSASPLAAPPVASSPTSYSTPPAPPPQSAAPTPTLAIAPGLPSPMASPSPAPAKPSPIASAPPASPTAPATPTPRRRLPTIFWAFLIVLGVGTASAWVGSNIPRWVTEWSSQRDDSGRNSGNDSGGQLESSSQFSAAEQRRKADLQAQRDRLRVSNKFLVQLTDVSFYEQYPQQKGRALTAKPEDAEWREKWDAIAAQWLTQLETLLDGDARSKLGTYGKSNRDQWKKIANGMNVSSRALYRFADMEFFTSFPEQQEQDFINQPIGQIWHGMADLNLRRFQSGETLETIQFPSGAYSTTLEKTVKPGHGHTYLLNAKEGQILRISLKAPRTLLSLYVPRPNSNTPFLLENSLDQTWSGQLPQSGYYEIVVLLDHPNLSAQASNQDSTIQLRVSVDNVATPVTPAPPEPNEEE